MNRKPRFPYLMLVCFCLTARVSAQENKCPPLPAGLADIAAQTGVLSNPTGGLDVVDLATGDLLWETKEAQRPVIILGQKLYAQAAIGKNGLRLLAFDLADQGPCIFASNPAILPDWAHIQEGRGYSFTTHWHQDRNRLVLTWQAAAWHDAGLFRLVGKSAARNSHGNFDYVTGKMAKLEASDARKEAAGRVAFDLVSSKVEALPYQLEKPTPPLLVPHDASKLVIRWQGEVAGNYTAITLESINGQEALIWRVWDRVTGKPAAPKELLRGRRPVVLPSLDGHFICLRDVMPCPDQRRSEEDHSRQYGWSVVALENGTLIARLPHEAGTHTVSIIGPRAYFLVAGPLKGSINQALVRPQFLKAVDLKSGKTLWQRPVENKMCTPLGT